MSQPIALLVVHGIGSQKPGETLGNCAAGLQRAYPLAELSDDADRPIAAREIRARKLTRVSLRTPGWQVNLYEVYWADLLSGESVAGSFNKFLLEEIMWFPWFNWRIGLLDRAYYSRWSVYRGIAQLWLLAIAGTISYELVPRSIHRRVLDQVVADVWNYTHSLGRLLRSSSPLVDAGEAILARLGESAERARAEGCGELQIVAHSLGTVVTYNSVSRLGATSCLRSPIPITRLYTIGSPLEKFRFIWNPLMRLPRRRTGLSCTSARHLLHVEGRLPPRSS